MCWKPWNNYFRRHGNLFLSLVTLVEILFYIAYTVVYCLLANEKGQTIGTAQIFKWVLTAVLLLS